MRADQPRVVVTGLGATSPVGGDVATTWASLLAGRSGARRLPEDWAPDLPVQIAAPAAVDPATVLERVQARRLDRCEQLAIIAAREAWADAGRPRWHRSGSGWWCPAASAVSPPSSPATT